MNKSCLQVKVYCLLLLPLCCVFTMLAQFNNSKCFPLLHVSSSFPAARLPPSLPSALSIWGKVHRSLRISLQPPAASLHVWYMQRAGCSIHSVPKGPCSCLFSQLRVSFNVPMMFTKCRKTKACLCCFAADVWVALYQTIAWLQNPAAFAE